MMVYARIRDINKKKMKRWCVFFVFFIFLSPLGGANVQGADIYVDKTLSGNCSGNYSIANRTCSGSDGDAYTTVQTAVTAMSGGDDIFIRGGTYYENVFIAQSKDGSSNNYSSIQSYPGEWAIINGQNNAGYTLGHRDTGSLGRNDRHYWLFQRLEITGGTNGTDGGYGIGINGDHFIVRYCFVHDNFATSGSENPGGIGGYCWRDSVIEFNRFYHNGTSSGDNGGDVMIFADYRYTKPEVYFNTGTYEGYYYARNSIRYNYFSGGSANGVRQKSSMNMLGNDDNRDYSLPHQYMTWGDKIHHNIFENYSHAGAQIWQDFAQVYNNIASNADLEVGSYTSGYGQRIAHQLFYNNTLLNGSQILRMEGRSDTNVTPRMNALNNIIDNFSYAGVHIGWPGPDEAHTSITQSIINRNYIYRPTGEGHLQVGGYDGEGRTVSSFNSYYETNNYYKSTSEGSDNLFQGTSGSSQYKTRSTHVINDGITVKNAGGGSHTYLTNVTLPYYIGATGASDSGADWDPNNPLPDDAGWLDYVLSLKNIDTLKSGGDNTSRPSAPSDFQSVPQ